MPHWTIKNAVNVGIGALVSGALAGILWLIVTSLKVPDIESQLKRHDEQLRTIRANLVVLMQKTGNPPNLKELENLISQTDKSLIDHQKQILQNKRYLEDTARRVYFMESLICARSAVVPQVKEGYVTFVDGNRISISLGSVNDVKVGDNFAVLRDTYKIGTIQIDTLEMNSAKGVVINVSKDKTIIIGDKIEIEKKTSK